LAERGGGGENEESKVWVGENKNTTRVVVPKIASRKSGAIGGKKEGKKKQNQTIRRSSPEIPSGNKKKVWGGEATANTEVEKYRQTPRFVRVSGTAGVCEWGGRQNPGPGGVKNQNKSADLAIRGKAKNNMAEPRNQSNSGSYGFGKKRNTDGGLKVGGVKGGGGGERIRRKTKKKGGRDKR